MAPKTKSFHVEEKSKDERALEALEKMAAAAEKWVGCYVAMADKAVAFLDKLPALSKTFGLPTLAD